MKLEKIDVSKDRISTRSVIRVNDSDRGRISRTSLTERKDTKNKKTKCRRK